MKWFSLFRYLTLQIEPTSACNLNCKICMRRNLERSPSFLSFDNFRRILDSGNPRYVGLHGWGEPLLNQQLFEMIRYAESKGVSTSLTTNGTLVQENIDGIFGSGLREIAFGVYDRELFSKVASQIEELIREKKGIVALKGQKPTLTSPSTATTSLKFLSWSGLPRNSEWMR